MAEEYEEVGWTLTAYIGHYGISPFRYSRRHLRRNGEVRTLCGRMPSIEEGPNWIGDCRPCSRAVERDG